MLTKSQKKVAKVLFIIITVLLLIPLAVIFTNLILNKPKVRPLQTLTVPKQDPNNSPKYYIIDGLIPIQVKNDNNWNHKILESSTNSIGERTQTIEFKNNDSLIKIKLYDKVIGLAKNSVKIDRLNDREYFSFYKFEDCKDCKVVDKDYKYLFKKDKDKYRIIDNNLKDSEQYSSTIDLFLKYNLNNKNIKLLSEIEVSGNEESFKTIIDFINSIDVKDL